MTKDQSIENDREMYPEFLAMLYFKNSGIANLEPDLLVKSY